MKNCPIIFVIGAGAFGSALSSVIASRGNSCVTLLGRRKNLIQQLKESRIHAQYFPSIKLSHLLNFSTDYKRLREADIVLFVTSSKGYGEAIHFYKQWLKNSADVIICSKGFEYHSGSLLCDYSEKILSSQSCSILSGPGFASDIIQGLPVAVTLASKNIEKSKSLSAIISHKSFQVHCSDDRIGVQMGGALKNIIAIASGILKGRKLGDSARAMILVQGLAEVTAITEILGGRAETVGGLSGLGDLILTATSEQSRNFCFGVLLGEGKKTDLDKMGLVEGAFAASRATKLTKGTNLKFPIVQAIADVVANRITIDEVVNIFLNLSF
ncbi:MAG: NAD(P)-dependent glycerol-3-phosphate dehydrogenase [Candidatus Liberibacter ctenarytainae]|uniref:Glycerol-3-phosphate dehydrogenase [NAD(P)+] n=1 Tax=Candidatus Liberibacter ctenarytainae TaxID=2020335 RepID=A0A937AFS2_9HYPH|nr:NAD(P)-dependent glycerol-3-phosphate dehydrogenase [Candidatus Liberibacter ctenarytainae]